MSDSTPYPQASFALAIQQITATERSDEMKKQCTKFIQVAGSTYCR